MITDLELDRVMTTWLAEGDDRAPADDVRAALMRVATTRQRRGILERIALRGPAGHIRRGWWLVAALLLAALLVAAGIGSGIVRLPSPPTPVVPPPPALVALRAVTIADWSVDLSVPDSWVEVDSQCCDYRQFGGRAPEGHISVNHESPYRATVCSPGCEAVDVSGTIPYSASAQLDALKSGVARIAGNEDWSPLAADLLPEVVGGARLESVALDGTGRAWRRVHIVGLRDRNLVAIAWSQPADVYDPALLDSVLREMELPAAPRYSDGDLVAWSGASRFTMALPGLWIDSDQPTVDGVPLSGLYRFAEGRILVSIGGTGGTLGWCDPDCHLLTGQTSLDALERSMRRDPTLGPSTDVRLDGEPARSMGTDSSVGRRVVVTVHDGRPVALMIDPGDWVVGPGIIDEMIAAFEFAKLEPVPAGQVFTTANGLVEISLPAGWRQDPNDSNLFTWAPRRMTVVVGDTDGSIVPCDRPAGPWELCRTIRVSTLRELAEAVQPAPIADHGVGPPVGRTEEVTLDGEDALMVRIPAYEYPARSGQEVVYIVAVHNGRPYVVRNWTSANRVANIESIIDGFKFVD